ncbi:MAG: ferric reductase-like transmembrane domain-containing protein [Patescibacteria group bacterium]|nr:ferric reductase-like transmembrane domain-containing protein [Patescibacteria group bacterium]
MDTSAQSLTSGVPPKSHVNPLLRLWGSSFAVAGLLYGFFLAYAAGLTGSISQLSLTMAFAGTGAILIGTSFALSGICYFFNFADRHIGYRKYLGLLGYYSALAYALLLIPLEPERYWSGWPQTVLQPDVQLGLTAMAILTLMALVSNTKAMQLLGPERWREILRLGYVAYFLLVIRATYLDFELWTAWFAQPVTLPPFRLTLSVFAILVILLRIAVSIHKRFSLKGNRPHLTKLSTATEPA